jgi:hypothetical protein
MWFLSPVANRSLQLILWQNDEDWIGWVAAAAANKRESDSLVLVTLPNVWSREPLHNFLGTQLPVQVQEFIASVSKSPACAVRRGWWSTKVAVMSSGRGLVSDHSHRVDSFRTISYPLFRLKMMYKCGDFV